MSDGRFGVDVRTAGHAVDAGLVIVFIIDILLRRMALASTDQLFQLVELQVQLVKSGLHLVLFFSDLIQFFPISLLGFARSHVPFANSIRKCLQNPQRGLEQI